MMTLDEPNRTLFRQFIIKHIDISTKSLFDALDIHINCPREPGDGLQHISFGPLTSDQLDRIHAAHTDLEKLRQELTDTIRASYETAEQRHRERA